VSEVAEQLVRGRVALGVAQSWKARRMPGNRAWCGARQRETPTPPLNPHWAPTSSPLLPQRSSASSTTISTDASSTTSSSSSSSSSTDTSSQRARYRIYTKTGDAGTSSLYNNVRLPKDDGFFEALGDVDELNGCIGLAREHASAIRGAAAAAAADAAGAGASASPLPPWSPPPPFPSTSLVDQLQEIQSRLLDVGSAVATPISTSRPEQVERVAFSPAHTTQLEEWIDEMEECLPPLKNFILPSGGLASSQLHVCRSVCRRAERRACALVREGELAAPVAVYLNRLSDYLFVAARYAAMRTGHTEQIYKMSRGLFTTTTTAAATAGKGAGTGKGTEGGTAAVTAEAEATKTPA
jgi:cob(I)alamin adenosyltransferase